MTQDLLGQAADRKSATQLANRNAKTSGKLRIPTDRSSIVIGDNLGSSSNTVNLPTESPRGFGGPIALEQAGKTVSEKRAIVL